MSSIEECARSAPRKNVIGSVKWYDKKKGFGFFLEQSTQQQFFLHSSTVGAFPSLRRGDTVVVDLVQTEKGIEVGEVISYLQREDSSTNIAQEVVGESERVGHLTRLLTSCAERIQDPDTFRSVTAELCSAAKHLKQNHNFFRTAAFEFLQVVDQGVGRVSFCGEDEEEEEDPLRSTSTSSGRSGRGMSLHSEVLALYSTALRDNWPLSRDQRRALQDMHTLLMLNTQGEEKTEYQEDNKKSVEDFHVSDDEADAGKSVYHSHLWKDGSSRPVCAVSAARRSGVSGQPQPSNMLESQQRPSDVLEGHSRPSKMSDAHSKPSDEESSSSPSSVLQPPGEISEQPSRRGVRTAEEWRAHCSWVVQQRTSRFVVVLECIQDVANKFAILRTLEALGVMEVWLVRPLKMKVTKGAMNAVSKKAQQWLKLRHFNTARECIAAACEENQRLWVTHLHSDATPLVAPLDIPDRLAIVIGSEHFGVSAEMLQAADKVVYLPMFGFVESLNVSVATALVVQRLFDLCPEARGDLSENQRSVILPIWEQNISNRLNDCLKSSC